MMLGWRLALVAISALASAAALRRIARAHTLTRGALVAVLWLWAAAAGTAVVTAPEHAAAAVESLIYLAVLLFLLGSPSLVASIQAAPRLVVGGAALAWALAFHVQIRNAGTPYPLVPWAMYGDGGQFDTLSFYEYVGVHPDGREERLALADVFPSLGADRLRIALDEIAVKATRTDASGPLADTVGLFDAVLQALSRVYNMNHRDHPIDTLVVYACRVTVPASGPPGPLSMRKVWSVKVE